ncbi:MAG TPA: 50S ribosomal protein L30 [Coriobacteriia bacterium]
MTDKRLSITQVRSTIGCPADQRQTVRALGLKRIRHTVEQPDNACVRGMVMKVRHLVETKEL